MRGFLHDLYACELAQSLDLNSSFGSVEICYYSQLISGSARVWITL